MSSSGQAWVPPTPLGEPFRARPEADIPFERETPGEERRRLIEGAWVGPTDGPQARAVPLPQLAPSEPASPAEQRARWALWVGVASIFVFNVVLGPLAMILGAQSMRRGQRELGRRALIFGALGTVIGIAVLTLVALGVMPSTEELLKRLREGS